MQPLTRESPAKINLTLRVTGRRPDGFHEIESLVAQVGLCDAVTVSLRDDRQFTLECNDPRIPADESNLALRAARALAAATGCPRGVHIELDKQIPPGSGLGGGSSNAATTLSLLNELWRLDLPKTELRRIGTRLGSDVPLFFHGPLCVVRGRGERVEDVPERVSAWATLILPQVHCSTPEVYAAWDRMPEPPSRPALDDVRAKLGSPDELMAVLYNDLEAPARAVAPALGEIADRVGALAKGPVCMSGSGSALFRLFGDAAAAADLARRVRQQLGIIAEPIALR